MRLKHEVFSSGGKNRKVASKNSIETKKKDIITLWVVLKSRYNFLVGSVKIHNTLETTETRIMRWN